MASFKLPNRSLPVRWRGSLDGLLGDGHLARFIWTVLVAIDFSELEAQYPSVQGGPGRPPYHPRLMAALWIYGMSCGLETGVGIALACELRDDFKWLGGGLCPCDQTLLNFLTRAKGRIGSIWIQVLQKMHIAGFIDISTIIEDGTKMRANASPKSFRPLSDIKKVISELRSRLEKHVEALAHCDDEVVDRKVTAEVAALRSRLRRAELAESELSARARQSCGSPTQRGQPAPPDSRVYQRPRAGKRFGRERFERDDTRRVLVCPAGEDLRFIGEYPTDNRQGTYLLYSRRDCAGCPLKEQCTQGRARRVKVPGAPRAVRADADPDDGMEETAADGDVQSGADGDSQPQADSEHETQSKAEKKEPQASLTEPEARWMLATSRKRWEPSFNADIAVTADGVIVSQFLTKDTTDFHHFAPALAFVQEVLGTPEHWIGDGHYGTEANLLLADADGVLLYAPRAGTASSPQSSPGTLGDSAETTERAPKKAGRFTKADFKHDADRNGLVCPAGEDLPFIGEYPKDNRRGTYLLYGRRECTGCSSKGGCTQGRGRRVKYPSSAPAPAQPSRSPPARDVAGRGDRLPTVLHEHAERMEERGKELMKLRGHTSESANAHLKQHGLGRFHVRGLARCGTVLTLGCIAHNLMKWRARAAAALLRLAS